MINQKILLTLQRQQFYIKEVGSKTLVFKEGKSDKVGKVYDNGQGIFFHSNNVAPFKEGKNSIKDILGDVPADYKPIFIKSEAVGKNYSFSEAEYIAHTQIEHTLKAYIEKTTKTTLKNLHCVRGVKNTYSNNQKNYLGNEVVFPYFDYDNQFITAKIVSYNPTGKRVKIGVRKSGNWFHSYKPIKDSIGILQQKTYKRKKSFFGEQLLKGNSKNIVIVEGEKTAIICQEKFDNIIFLATGGATQLKGLNYKYLKGRNVFLFADKGVSEWFEIGKKQGWECSHILENSIEAVEGSDILDYINTPLWNDISNSLKKIGTFALHDTDQNKANALNKPIGLAYSKKSKPNKETCLPNWYELKFRGYDDTAEQTNPTMECFEGKHFKFYKNDFVSWSANIDFNSLVGYGKELREPTETDFIENLEKVFRVAKFINSSAEKITYIKTVSQQFEHVLNHLAINCNYNFNIDFILNELMPEWNSKGNDISEYISKPRNYRVLKGNIPKDKFESYLAEDKRIYSTNTLIKKIYRYIKDKRYISLKNDLQLSHKNENSFIFELVKTYNENVVGCSTINQWNTAKEIQSYCNEIDKRVQNPYTPYKSTYIECTKNVPKIKPIVIKSILKKAKIPKRAVSRYFNHKPNVKIYKDLMTIAEYLIECPNDLKFLRSKRRIEVKPLYTIKEMNLKLSEIRETERQSLEMTELQNKVNYNITPGEAFNYELDISNGVFSCSEKEATEKGREFLYNWLCVNRDLKGIEKSECWANPEAYLSDKTLNN